MLMCAIVYFSFNRFPILFNTMTVYPLKKHFSAGLSELLKDIRVFVSPILQAAGEMALHSMQSSTETGKFIVLLAQ